MRIACLLVPDLPLRAELRIHPTLIGLPLAIASGREPQAEVIAASPEALCAGVCAPSSIPHARAVCPELRVRVASPAADRACRQALLDVALSCSPRAAPVPRGTGSFAAEAAVFLDATGLTSLFRSEQGLATALASRAEALGLPGMASLASSRSVAHLLARQLARQAARATADCVRSHVLPPGREAALLDPLPIDLLDPDDQLAQALTRFGVRTMRDLLRLPQSALAQRLGPDVLLLMAQARGEERGLPLPRPVETQLREATDLEVAIDQLEPLLFVLRSLLSRLVERLAMRGMGCGPLDLQLHLTGGAHDTQRIGVAAPTRDSRVLLRLLSLALQANPPKAPIEGLSLGTVGQPIRSDQLDLFRRPGPDPAALDQTLAELESLCGPGRVGAPKVADDHRPGAFEVKPFRTPSGAGRTPEPRCGAAKGESADRVELEGLAVRALRPPVTAEVRVHQGRPEWVRSAVASGHVQCIAGPWRTTGQWWAEEGRFALDHYDVQVSDGTLLRLCFDWIDKLWRIDAVYD